ARRALPVVLALALSAKAGAAQADAKELRDRARALAGVLAATRDPDEAERARLELAELSGELVERYESAGGEHGGRGYLPALYHAFSARGELERAAGAAEREEWLSRAHTYAERWGDAEAEVRSRLLLGGLW